MALVREEVAAGEALHEVCQGHSRARKHPPAQTPAVVVEQVLAITANGSIGYAAYYAATREHPDRYITLRHKNRIVSRWNEAKH